MAAPERFADTPDSFPLHRGRRPYMAAPERFAKTPDSFPLHRGRRPYMARSVGASMSALPPLSKAKLTFARAMFHHPWKVRMLPQVASTQPNCGEPRRVAN